MVCDAFLSYKRHDVKKETVAELRSRIEQKVGNQLGRSATIFQDAMHIRPGQVWQDEIDHALEECPCLIAFITPAYMESDGCVDEFLKFVDLHSNEQHAALVIPIYYIEVPAIEHKLGRQKEWQNTYDEKRSRVVDIIVDERQMANLSQLDAPPEDKLNTSEANGQLGQVAVEIARQVRRQNQVVTPLVVAKDGSGLGSIGEAVRQADPGTRILVKGPAEYRESVYIDKKPLQIISEPGVTLIGVDGPAVLCRESMVQIEGMRVTAEGGNGITVSGGCCVLERLEVFGTNYSGVLIRDGAKATVMECSLHHAEDCGLHAQYGSRCTVLNSTIRENHVGGLFFSQDAEGLVEGNLIERNRYNGIYVAAGAHPSIRRNRIRNHDKAGILVYHHKHGDFVNYLPGRGLIEDNEIDTGAEYGIEIKEGGDPCVRGNTIKHNAYGGIWTWDGGKGTIIENRIVDNAGSGIKNEGGSPLIGKNYFRGNGGQQVEDNKKEARYGNDAGCGD